MVKEDKIKIIERSGSVLIISSKTIHFGKNPKKGGSPPKDIRFKAKTML